MGKLEEALQEKIELLHERREELESEIQLVDSQIEVCESLLSGDVEALLAAPSPKRKKKTTVKVPAKKRGRPRKKTIDPELAEAQRRQYEEAKNSLPDGSTGTTKEEQERAIRRFHPMARPEDTHGNVVVGSTKGKPAETRDPDPLGHKSISIDDDSIKEEK